MPLTQERIDKLQGVDPHRKTLAQWLLDTVFGVLLPIGFLCFLGFGLVAGFERDPGYTIVLLAPTVMFVVYTLTKDTSVK